ncbi:MAG TPA: S41 family peptidase [Ruminiclostridium sp.]
MKKLRRITAIVLVVSLTVTVFCTSIFAAETPSTSNNGDYLKEVMELIKQKYNGNITEEELTKAAVKGMFGALDKYSTFYEQKEFNSVMGTYEGAIEGVGVLVELIDGYVTIMEIYPESPAQKAGVRIGDKIAQVNGQPIVNKKLEDVVGELKGPVNTKVKIGLLRQGAKDIITLEVARAQVTVPSVKYEIRGDIGYILIDMFIENTNSGVSEALNLFDSKKITKVVLDLRNNPGGLVDQAVEVAKHFVPKGLITTLDYKDAGVADETYYSTLAETKYKLAVLVNENSASSSEIFTGAIKDTKAGVVIGNKTFGKAKVQSYVPILSTEAYERLNKNNESKTVNAYDIENTLESDLIGWGKMTIGMYYTPNGECIDLKGIEPNIKVQETSPSGISVNLIEPLNVAIKPSLGTQCSDVYYAECILKLLKYNVDTPDLTLDKKTFAAIKKFQVDNKVSSYGVLDYTTQKLLNKKLDTLKQTIDPVYAKAIVELKK